MITFQEAITAILVVALFFLVSFLAQSYSDELINLMEARGRRESMAIYVIGAALATVLAPFSFIPFLPVAVVLFGSLQTALLSIIGWTIGAAIAFYLARRYGHPLVHRLIAMERLERLQKRLPSQIFFWSVVGLRMLLPVDILSYALALFTEMPFGQYLLATIIGITPFAFIFSYAAALGF